MKVSEKYALLIGNSEYDTSDLSKLTAPDSDVEGLANVLKDKSIGGFDVTTSLDEPSHEVSTKIVTLFANKRRDDIVLLYFSGHGVKDDQGRLFLAFPNTKLNEHLDTTAVMTRWIVEKMDKSRSKRQVLLLDCCHSGAFLKGGKGGAFLKGCKGKGSLKTGTQEIVEGEFEPPATPKTPKGPNLEGKTNGYGRFVLTASDAFQYALEEKGKVEGEPVNSVFTKHVITGLETGEADLNEDTYVSIDELAEYVRSGVKIETDKQAPEYWAFGKAGGHLIIAKHPNARPNKAKLTSEKGMCFVISPLSIDPKRADEVLEKYIKPACNESGFWARRSDMEMSPKITPQIRLSLERDPMVVAYLGKPPWNANVMLEIGLRMAIGKPIVLLREKKGQNEEEVPFDLHDHRILELPGPGENDRETTQDSVEKIIKLIDARTASESIWETSFPLATAKFDLDKNEWWFDDVSDETALFFGFDPGVKEIRGADATSKMKDLMTDEQFMAFVSDQGKIVGDLVARKIDFMQPKGTKQTTETEMPIATVPIVFANHEKQPELVDKAFLPLIIQTAKQGSELWMDLIYVNVTKAVKAAGRNKSHKTCILRD